MDTPDALSRLEAHGPAAAVEADSGEGPPKTPREAASRWLASLGVRPGMTHAPKSPALAGAFAAWALAQGWDVAPEWQVLTHAFRMAGCHRGPNGFLVARDAAARLWRAAGRPPVKRKGSRKPRPKPKPPRVTRHPSKPLRACDGRMWRSQRDAMASLGTNAMAICKAVREGTAVAGVHLRFATPAEVAIWRGEEWDGGIGSPS